MDLIILYLMYQMFQIYLDMFNFAESFPQLLFLYFKYQIYGRLQIWNKCFW